MIRFSNKRPIHLVFLFPFQNLFHTPFGVKPPAISRNQQKVGSNKDLSRQPHARLYHRQDETKSSETN